MSDEMKNAIDQLQLAVHELRVSVGKLQDTIGPSARVTENRVHHVDEQTLRNIQQQGSVGTSVAQNAAINPAPIARAKMERPSHYEVKVAVALFDSLVGSGLTTEYAMLSVLQKFLRDRGVL